MAKDIETPIMFEFLSPRNATQRAAVMEISLYVTVTDTVGSRHSRHRAIKRLTVLVNATCLKMKFETEH